MLLSENDLLWSALVLKTTLHEQYPFFVQRLTQFLSGLKARHVLCGNVNRLAGFRIAALSSIVPFQIEGPKPTVLNANPASQGAIDGAEHFVHSPLGLAVGQRYVMLEDPVN